MPSEIAALFPANSLGPWKVRQDYTCFLLAATVGMTRQELIALKWRHISFQDRAVSIQDVWKGLKEGEGEPKWGRVRTAPLPEKAVERLKGLQDDSIRTGLDDYIFCDELGNRLGETWWRKRFIWVWKRPESTGKLVTSNRTHSGIR